MRQLYKSLISLLILLVLFTPIYAQNVIVVIVDKTGVTKVIHSAESVENINLALDIDNSKVPKDVTTLILEDGKEPVWTSESLDVIYEDYNDSSTTSKTLPQKDKPTEKKTPSNKNHEEKVAEKIMQPEDGTWQLSVISNTYDTGCPRDPFPPQSIQGMTRPVDIKWGIPWKPMAFFQHYPTKSDFHYVQTSPTQWEVSGIMLKKVKFVSIDLKEDFTLINPKEIQVNATVTMKMTIPQQSIKLPSCKGYLKMSARKK